MKTCTGCKRSLAFEKFGKASRLKSGLRSQCRECVAAYDARPERCAARAKTSDAWRAANREYIAARDAKRYAADPERHRAQSKAWAAANSERRSEQNKRWCEDNAERKKANMAAWAKKNAASRRLSAARRRAMIIEATIEPFTVDDLLDSYRMRNLSGCTYCGGPYEHDDHVVPLSRGGAHIMSNLVPTCGFCNQSKHDLLLEEWLERIADIAMAERIVSYLKDPPAPRILSKG